MTLVVREDRNKAELIPQYNNYKTLRTAQSGYAGTTTLSGAAAGNMSRTVFTQPQFYSPLHTPSNWQIPVKRREIIQWARFFANNEPKIAAALDFYSQFPFCGFTNKITDPVIQEDFDELKKHLRLEHWISPAVYDLLSIGDAFPYTSVNCKICEGNNGIAKISSGKQKKGEKCRHPGGTWNSLTLLNPDIIDIQSTPLNPDDEIISLIPDDSLRAVVFQRKPEAIYNKLPKNLINTVLQNKPIILNNNCVTHLWCNRKAYYPYGQSILIRLFPTLAYKDKLRQAQWIVADRHILPIRIIKVGSDERPATQADITDVQSQISSVANDPNLTLVTHNAFDYDFVGASGKVLQLSKEYDLINQDLLDGLMINQALLNGEGPNFCHSEDTEFLTLDGFKLYKDIKDNDKLATFNKNTGELEYQDQINRWEFDYNSQKDGPLYYFESDYIDCLVTKNHKMLVKTDENWENIEAKDIKSNIFLQNCIKKYNGKIEKENIFFDDENIKENIKFISILCSYIKNGENSELFKKQNDNLKKYIKSEFLKNNELILPTWFRNLPTYLLETTLSLLSYYDFTEYTTEYTNNIDYLFSCSTEKEKFADNIQEIALKCGYYTEILSNDCQYHVLWTKQQQDLYKFIDINKNKKLIEYNGKVSCFEVKNHFLITRRNSKIIITGNSSASVGIEAMIVRLEYLRHIVAEWIEEKIYKPYARMRGYYKKNTKGESVPHYPRVEFRELNLRDKSQMMQIYTQLNEKNKISNETLWNYLGLDPEEEAEKLRYENMIALQLGIGGTGQGEEGGMLGGGGLEGMLGGGGDMGGLGGGDMGDMGEEMGGGLPPPSSQETGAMGGAGTGGEALATELSPTIFKKGSYWDRRKLSKEREINRNKRNKEKEEQKNIEAKEELIFQRNNFTKPERIVYGIIIDNQNKGIINNKFFGQYKVNDDFYLTVDGAFPELKLAVEVQGPLHKIPEQIKRDYRKKMKLNKIGWEVIYFDSEEIEKNKDKVEARIIQTVNERQQ